MEHCFLQHFRGISTHTATMHLSSIIQGFDLTFFNPKDTSMFLVIKESMRNTPSQIFKGPPKCPTLWVSTKCIWSLAGAFVGM